MKNVNARLGCGWSFTLAFAHLPCGLIVCSFWVVWVFAVLRLRLKISA